MAARSTGASRRPPGDWPYSELVRELRAVLAADDGVESADKDSLPALAKHPAVLARMPGTGTRPFVRGLTTALTAAIEKLNNQYLGEALLWHFAIADDAGSSTPLARRHRAAEIAGYSRSQYAKEREDRHGEWVPSQLTKALVRLERVLDQLIPVTGQRVTRTAPIRPNQASRTAVDGPEVDLPRVAFVCALPSAREHAAVSERCRNLGRAKTPGAAYLVGELDTPTARWEIALLATGRGNSAAQAKTLAVLAAFEPAYAFFLGCGGGFKEKGIARGDLIVPRTVHKYQSAAALRNRKLSRPDPAMADPALVDTAELLQYTDWFTGTWQPSPPTIHFEDVVSGDVNVKSTRSAEYKFIRDNYNQAVAVEMEGYGFLSAARQVRVPALLVRGSSDQIDNKSERTDKVWQPRVTAAAFDLIAALLADLSPTAGDATVAANAADAQALPVAPAEAPLTMPPEGVEAAVPRGRRITQDGSKEADAHANRPRHNLPAQAYRPIVGRDQEIAAVLGHLRPYPHSQYPIVTIDGVGGVGKTALALTVGARALEAAPEGPDRFDAVIWSSAKREVLTIAGVTPQQHGMRNLDGIYAALAHTLDRPELITASPDDQHEIARSILSERRVLLIIDNLETVDDPRVLAFIRDLPAPTKALITTRHRIDGAIPIRLKGLPLSDAQTLVLSLADQDGSLDVGPDTQLDIARLTAGIPLAIQWTISQIAFGRPAAAALQRLRSAGGEFAAFCFRESYEMIGSDDRVSTRHVLLALSYFPYGATREDLAYVAGLTHAVQERDVALAELLRLSLINLDAGRFSLLPLTRDFLLAELGRDLEFRDTSQARWLQWAVALAQESSRGGTDLSQVVVERMSGEYGNLLSAVDAAFAAKDFETWVALIRGMEFYWLGTGRWAEFRDHLGLARSVAPTAVDRAHFTLRLAWLAVLTDDLGTADELVASGRVLLDATPDAYEEMRYWDFYGQLLLAQRAPDALEAFEHALKLAVELGDQRGRFAVTKYAGEAALVAGDVLEADRWLERAEAELEGELGQQWRRGIAHALHLRGLVHIAREEWEPAIAAFKTGLDNLTYWPDARLVTRIQTQLAPALVAAGRPDEARTTLHNQREMLLRLNLPGELAAVDSLLAELPTERSRVAPG